MIEPERGAACQAAAAALSSAMIRAALAAATLHSLATRARAGTPRSALKRLAKDLIAQVNAH